MLSAGGLLRANHAVRILTISTTSSRATENEGEIDGRDGHLSDHGDDSTCSSHREHFTLRELLARINKDVDHLDALAVVQSKSSSSSSSSSSSPSFGQDDVTMASASCSGTLPGNDDIAINNDNDTSLSSYPVPQLIKDHATHTDSLTIVRAMSTDDAEVVFYNAANSLRQRDLRRLDFKFNPVDEPVILVRRHAVLVRGDHSYHAYIGIQGIVSRRYCCLLHLLRWLVEFYTAPRLRDCTSII
jgi:hypothetical protein